MTASHLNRLLTHYDHRIVTAFPTVQPCRKGDQTIPLMATAEHLRWMVEEIRKMLDQGRVERAARWTGFIEGSLVQIGLASLEDIQMLDVESSFPGT
jgi:hypothetical protein